MRFGPRKPSEHGMSLVEMCIALVILTVGLLAAAQFFPTGSRAMTHDRLLASGNLYSQQKVEQLTGLSWSDAQLSLGRHPAGTSYEALGNTQAWKRYYIVSSMPAPLDNLRMITVGVTYDFHGRRDTVKSITYVRR